MTPIRACVTLVLLVASSNVLAQPADRPTFTVGTASAARGRTATGVIEVGAGSDAALAIPVAVVHGRQPGPVLALVAGSHGTEYASIIALEQLISDYFGIPCTVEQFVGGWFTVGRQDQCELDDGRVSSQLGMGALVGDEIYDPQGRVRIRLGPLSRERYEAFLPTGAQHATLRRLASLFAHGQFEFELQLVLTREVGEQHRPRVADTGPELERRWDP